VEKDNEIVFLDPATGIYVPIKWHIWLYFMIVTMTTVGFGDITVTTKMG